MGTDPKWEEQNWFDELDTFEHLRKMQYNAGPEMVQTYGELFVGDLRLALLKVMSLFVLGCGAGKTLMMVAVLIAINAEVNKRAKAAPRCKHVLWFTKDREACRQLKKELESEPTKYRLHHTKPRVRIAAESGDLDITISCPHALWDRKDGRSDSEVQLVLSQYDVIIADECDFATGQLDQTIKLASNALKFGLTASPVDAKGKFYSKHFVLAGVATHQDVFDMDHCVKRILTWKDAKAQGFVKAIPHEGYSYHEGLETKEAQGQHGDRYSLPGAMTAIKTAIHDIISEEQQMKRLFPDDWFSQHMMVFCNSIEEANHLYRQTRIYVEERGLGPEWIPTIIHDKVGDLNRDHNLGLPAHELSLFPKGPYGHPFIRAKSAVINRRAVLGLSPRVPGGNRISLAVWNAMSEAERQRLPAFRSPVH